MIGMEKSMVKQLPWLRVLVALISPTMFGYYLLGDGQSKAGSLVFGGKKMG